MTKIPRKLKHFIMLPLGALFFFIGAFTVQAATYYVATTGSDAVPCANATNISTPRLTIKQGMNCMVAGDILYLRGGTYAEAIDTNSQTLPSGTSWNNAPIISGYPSETVTITFSTSYNIFNIAQNVQYISFENMIIDGQNTADNVVGIGTTGGTGANHVRLRNCQVKNTGHINVFLHGSNNWIDNCHVYNGMMPASSQVYNFYVEGSNNLIENSEIDHSNYQAITSYSGSNMPSGNTYRNNIIHHTGLVSISSGGLTLDKGINLLAYNNIIYSANGHGMIIGCCGTTNAHVYNSTVYGGAQTGIWIQDLNGATGTIVQNNIVYNNATAQIANNSTTAAIGYNLTTDPRFVNASGFDFSLQAGSAAIDAGVTSSEVLTDIRHTPRPQGGAYDIGAYEVGGSGSGSAPAPPANLTVK